MDYKVIEKRLQAAQSILHGDSVNRSTFDSLKTLLSGIHPKLDHALAQAGNAIKHIDHIQKSDVIALVAEGLPETTPEDKKRKKAILLFIKLWNDLKNEVARVEKEFASDPDTKHHSNAWGKIFGLAKGPLGVVTLKATEVSVTVQNNGCGMLTPPAINVPGLRLPGSIPSGGEVIVKTPPFSFTVDTTDKRFTPVTLMGMTYDFGGRPTTSVLFDGEEIIGFKRLIRLGDSPSHTLEIHCL